MLDVLCACGPTWKLRSPSAPSCERTFTTLFEPPRIACCNTRRVIAPKQHWSRSSHIKYELAHTSHPAQHVWEPRAGGCCAGLKPIPRPLAPPMASNLL